MKPVICIKIGGTAADQTQAVSHLLSEIKILTSIYNVVLIHGGGKEVSTITRKFGLEPNFIDGIRQTSIEEMDIVEMVLAGKVNKKLVRAAECLNIKAAGLCGSDSKLFTGKALNEQSRTGKIISVNTEILQILFDHQILPVISSVSMDKEGASLNINADEAALELAEALQAEILIYISDISGVIINNKIAATLNEQQCRSWIEKGEISGGMVPKVNSSLSGLHRGIRRVVISDYAVTGEIQKMINQEKGTTLLK